MAEKDTVALATQNLGIGDVRVQKHGAGWLLVEIGRGRYVKRFNLRRGEALELVLALSAELD